jgi:hypothetical protein
MTIQLVTTFTPSGVGFAHISFLLFFFFPLPEKHRRQHPRGCLARFRLWVGAGATQTEKQRRQRLLSSLFLARKASVAWLATLGT